VRELPAFERGLDQLVARREVRVLEAGDEVAGFRTDTAVNRRSVRKLAGLEPSLILPGHGGAVRDMAEFGRFVAARPGDSGRRGNGRSPSQETTS
jgi:hypothetical protein